MGIPSDARFLAAAGKQLRHLFPLLPKRPATYKRRQRLADTIEELIGGLCPRQPRLPRRSACWSTRPRLSAPASIETTRRSQLAEAADYGWCASHSRFFWGFRLHGLFALDGTPRALGAHLAKSARA